MDVNLAAAAEIARQLRLRDMGGIIVIDFIDLHKSENRTALVEEMRELMADRPRQAHHPAAVEVRPDADHPPAGAARDARRHARGLPGLPRHRYWSRPPRCSTTQIENQIAYYATGSRGARLHHASGSIPVVAAFLTKGLFSLRLRWMLRYRCAIRVVANTTIPASSKPDYFDRTERRSSF